MPRILLIDDTPETAELLTFALRDRGYEVSTTGYTNAIGDLLQQQPADALVVDCSGFDMSQAVFLSLRDDSKYADLPVVIIADTPERAEANLRALKARRVLLVPKPFTGGQVARALAQLLE